MVLTPGCYAGCMKETNAAERITLALIAHDARKDDMVELANRYKDNLARLALIATHGTGQIVQLHTGLPITLVTSESLGGDQQIGSLVASGIVKAVIFLRDPLSAQLHEPDVAALMRVCDVYNVPLATNIASAESVLHLIFEHPEMLHECQLEARLGHEISLAHND